MKCAEYVILHGGLVSFRRPWETEKQWVFILL